MGKLVREDRFQVWNVAWCARPNPPEPWRCRQLDNLGTRN